MDKRKRRRVILDSLGDAALIVGVVAAVYFAARVLTALD